MKTVENETLFNLIVYSTIKGGMAVDMKQKTAYIVTGAAGHLGRTIVHMLNEQGCPVYALCLPGEAHVPAWENVKIFQGDVRDIGSLIAMFEACAKAFAQVTVIHCAAIVSIASGFSQQVYDVNVGGTKNILSLCEKFAVDKLIYISSVHAIPELPAGETITEVAYFSPDNVVGLYAKTKAEATRCVAEYMSRGYHANVVHPSGIVGPGDFGRGHITQLIIDYYSGKLKVAINGGYDFVDVRDVAAGVLACEKQGKAGEFFILSGRYYKVYELLDLLHNITGKKKIKGVLPLWLAKFTAPLSELYYKILRQPPLFTAYSIYTLNTNGNFSHAKAARELGYTVRPMEETLRDTLAWLGEEKRL